MIWSLKSNRVIQGIKGIANKQLKWAQFLPFEWGQGDHKNLALLQWKGSSSTKSRILNHFQEIRSEGNAVSKLRDYSRYSGPTTAADISHS